MTTTFAARPATLGAASLLPVTGRVLMAAIYLISGLGKLAAPAATIAYIRSAGLPMPEVAFAGAAAVEVVGALLLIAGYRVRLVALGLAGFTLIAGFAFHAAFADKNQMIHFLKNVAMAGGLLQVAAFGAGRFSLDARRGRA